MDWSRRSVLRLVSAAALSPALPACAPDTLVPSGPGLSCGGSFEDLVLGVVETPPADLLAWLGARLASDASHLDLFAASLHAGLRTCGWTDLPPGSTLSIDAARRLAELHPPAAGVLVARIAARVNEAAGVGDCLEGRAPWSPPERSLPAPEDAEAALLKGLTLFLPPTAADSAGVLLLDDPERVWDLMTHYGLRNWFGHGSHAVATSGWLSLIDAHGACPEAVVRPLAHLVAAPLERWVLERLGMRGQAPWDEHKRLIEETDLRADDDLAPDDEVALDLLGFARTASIRSLPDHLLALIEDGAPPTSLWDGLALFTAEQVLAGGDPRMLATHAALRRLSAAAITPADRTLGLLQAASWQLMFEPPTGVVTLDAIEPAPEPVPDAASVLEQSGPNAVARAHRWLADGGSVTALQGAVVDRAALVGSGFEAVDAALMLASASGPSLQGLFHAVAAAVVPDDAPWDRYDEARVATSTTG